MCCYQMRGWRGQSMTCAPDETGVNCKANLLLYGILLEAKVGLDDFLKAWRRALELLEDCPVQSLLPAGTVWHKLSNVQHGEACNCTSAAAVTRQHSSQGSVQVWQGEQQCGPPDVCSILLALSLAARGIVGTLIACRGPAALTNVVDSPETPHGQVLTNIESFL